MFFLKLVASFFLVIALIVGALRANPKSHSPIRPAMAEYGAGFIIFILALWGLYQTWF